MVFIVGRPTSLLGTRGARSPVGTQFSFIQPSFSYLPGNSRPGDALHLTARGRRPWRQLGLQAALAGAAGRGARSANRSPVPRQERPPRAAWVARPAARGQELALGTAIKLAFTPPLDVKLCLACKRMVLERSSSVSAGLGRATFQKSIAVVSAMRQQHAGESFISIRPRPVTMRISSESSSCALSDAQVLTTHHVLRGVFDFSRLRDATAYARDHCCAAPSWHAYVCVL